MPKYPLISIVLITLNEEKNIIDCFKSISEIDYPKDRIDLICVDSNSTDNTIKLIKDFPIKKRLIIIDNFFRRPSFSINKGLEYCHGDFVQVMGGDVRLEKGWLKKAIEIFNKSNNKNLFCVNGLIEEVINDKNGSLFKIFYGLSLGGVKRGNIPCARGGGLFKVSLIRKYNFQYDSDLRTDDEVDIGIRMSVKGLIFKNISHTMIYHESEFKNNFNSFYSYIIKLIVLGKSRSLLIKKYLGKPEMKIFLQYIKLPVLFISILVTAIVSLILVFLFFKKYFYFFSLFLLFVFAITFLFISYKISQRKKVNLFISMLYVLNIFLLEFLISTSAMIFYIFKNFFIIWKVI